MAMEDYEEKVLFEYMLRVLKVDKASSRRLEYIYDLDVVDDKLKQLLEEDFDNGYHRGKRISKDIKDKDVISLLKETYQKKYANAKKSTVQKRIDYFCEVFQLEGIQKTLLSYFIRVEISNTFSAFNEQFLNEHGRFQMGLSRLAMLFNCSVSEINKTIGKLRQSRFIASRGYDITDNLSDLFNSTDINNKSDVIRFILGKKVKSTLKWTDFNHQAEDRDAIFNIVKNALELKEKGVNILFYGKVGTGKTELAKLIAQKVKTDLFFVSNIDCSNDEMSRSERLNDLYSKIFMPIDRDFCVLFDEAEDVLCDNYFEKDRTSKSYVNTLLEESRVPIFWTTNNIYNVDKSFLRRMTYVVKFDELDNDTKLNIWKKELKKQKVTFNNKNLIEDITKKYNVSPSLISNAVKVARLTGKEDLIERSLETMSELLNKGFKVQNDDNPVDLNMYRLDFVNCKNDINFLTKQIVKSGNLNFSLCLYGESGTGKSAYARYLADKLNIPVVFKRASDLLGCYVGETEQNIASAFDEARNKKAMLIFDEADSFLNSRTMAQRSWEISHVNEMLTQMESYEYPFVCTTNLVDRLDEASLRRFMFKLKFEFLTKEQIKNAFRHFFEKDATEEILKIKGLTTSDMNNVRRKVKFLNVEDVEDITKMLNEEVALKKADELKSSVGFSS